MQAQPHALALSQRSAPVRAAISLWDLAKPVIAQIHGYAMAGGLELAGACDLAYASLDARLSHPVLRFALPDFAWFPIHLAPRHAMELHLCGREYTGEEAARIGLVNQAFPADELGAEVLRVAARIAEVPAEALAINKRFVYTALEHQGSRAIVRTGGDLQAGPHLQTFTGSSAELSEEIRSSQRKRRGESA